MEFFHTHEVKFDPYKHFHKDSESVYGITEEIYNTKSSFSRKPETASLRSFATTVVNAEDIPCITKVETLALESAKYTEHVLEEGYDNISIDSSSEDFELVRSNESQQSLGAISIPEIENPRSENIVLEDANCRGYEPEVLSSVSSKLGRCEASFKAVSATAFRDNDIPASGITEISSFLGADDCPPDTILAPPSRPYQYIADFLPPPAREICPEAEDYEKDMIEDVGFEARDIHRVIPDGNCWLFIKNEEGPILYLVSSHVISRASLVLKEQLNGHDHKSLHSHRHRVRGDPGAWLSILRIIHWEDDDSLLDICFDSLREISIICEYYQFQRPLRLWSQRWLLAYTPNTLEPGKEDWLFIFKTFGSGVRLPPLIVSGTQNLVDALSEECSTVSDCDTYVLRLGKVVDKTRWPTEFLGEIMRKRESKVDGLIQNLRDSVQSFWEASLSRCSNQHCIELAYGSLCRSIKERGLEPLLMDTGEWCGSFRCLRQRVNTLSMNTLSTIGLEHACNLKFCLDDIRRE